MGAAIAALNRVANIIGDRLAGEIISLREQLDEIKALARAEDLDADDVAAIARVTDKINSLDPRHSAFFSD
jgi:hypothetical protein